jgi:hypothetical protein
MFYSSFLGRDGTAKMACLIRDVHNKKPMKIIIIICKPLFEPWNRNRGCSIGRVQFFCRYSFHIVILFDSLQMHHNSALRPRTNVGLIVFFIFDVRPFVIRCLIQFCTIKYPLSLCRCRSGHENMCVCKCVLSIKCCFLCWIDIIKPLIILFVFISLVSMVWEITHHRRW